MNFRGAIQHFSISHLCEDGYIICQQYQTALLVKEIDSDRSVAVEVSLLRLSFFIRRSTTFDLFLEMTKLSLCLHFSSIEKHCVLNHLLIGLKGFAFHFIKLLVTFVYDMPADNTRNTCFLIRKFTNFPLRARYRPSIRFDSLGWNFIFVSRLFQGIHFRRTGITSGTCLLINMRSLVTSAVVV